MSRLTRRVGTDVYMLCGDNCYTGGDCNLCAEHDILLDRLAAYEDTGTEPEEIGDVVMHCKDLGLGGLLGLLNAIATDRLIVLPCKVGDTVWSGEPFVNKRICEGVIVEINIDTFGFCGFWVSFTSRAIAAEFIKEDIGKTVFFTREEAEAAKNGE